MTPHTPRNNKRRLSSDSTSPQDVSCSYELDLDAGEDGQAHLALLVAAWDRADGQRSRAEDARARAEEKNDTFLADLLEDFDCGVCLDIMVRPVITLCGHTACSSCIVRWLQNAGGDERTTCPICRSQAAFPAVRDVLLNKMMHKWLPQALSEEELMDWKTRNDDWDLNDALGHHPRHPAAPAPVGMLVDARPVPRLQPQAQQPIVADQPRRLGPADHVHDFGFAIVSAERAARARRIAERTAELERARRLVEAQQEVRQALRPRAVERAEPRRDDDGYIVRSRFRDWQNAPSFLRRVGGDHAARRIA